MNAVDSWQHLHVSDNQVHVHPLSYSCSLGFASYDDMKWNVNAARAEAGYPELPQEAKASYEYWEHEHAGGQIVRHRPGFACILGEPEGVAVAFKMLPQDEWAVNLNVREKSIKKADEVYWAFCELSRQLRLKDLDYVSVSCYRVTEEDELDADETEEFHDENTLVKVNAAIKEALTQVVGDIDRDSMSIINSLQNHGILFRERH